MVKGAAESNRREARERIQRKLAVLKGYWTDGVPAGAFVPKSINQFRTWEDEGRGLRRIGSPNTMSARSSPHNKDLIDEVNQVLAALAAGRVPPDERSSRQSGVNAKNRELRELRAKLAQLEDLTPKLARDWHLAQNEVADLRQRNRDLEQRHHDLVAEISGLRSELAAKSRGGLRSVDGTLSYMKTPNEERADEPERHQRTRCRKKSR